MMPDYIANKHD
jgi:hypothetical protein